MEQERKEQQNNKSIIIVTILCAALFGISIAYAALSATLTITMGKVTQNALTWNVGFETGTVNGTSTGGATCGQATATSDSVTVANTTLATLHDKCVYKLKVKNTGSVAAQLSAISAKTPSSVTCNTTTTSQMVCGNITYKLTTDAAGSTLLGTGGTLAASSGTLDVYLSAEYTGTETGASSEQNNGGFTLTYSQK